MRGANCSTTWVELVVSAGATAVSIKDDTETWEALTYNASWGKWVKATSVSAGSKVVAKATRADGATAYSPIFTWMQQGPVARGRGDVLRRRVLRTAGTSTVCQPAPGT